MSVFFNYAALYPARSFSSSFISTTVVYLILLPSVFSLVWVCACVFLTHRITCVWGTVVPMIARLSFSLFTETREKNKNKSTKLEPLLFFFRCSLSIPVVVEAAPFAGAAQSVLFFYFSFLYVCAALLPRTSIIAANFLPLSPIFVSRIICTCACRCARRTRKSPPLAPPLSLESQKKKLVAFFSLFLLLSLYVCVSRHEGKENEF